METAVISRSSLMVKHFKGALNMDGIENGAVLPLVMTMMENGETAQVEHLLLSGFLSL